MERITDRNPEQRIEKEKKARIKVIILVNVIVLVVAFAVLYFILTSYENKQYDSLSQLERIDRVDETEVTYLAYQGDIMKYSRDGASAFNTKGEALWNGSYEMDHPEADVNGAYVAIADIGAKEAYVFNGKDSGTRIETTLPIKEVEVASQGVVALRLEDTDSDAIHLYDPYSSQDKLLVEVPTNVVGDGYPIDFDLSEDGTSLVTAYVNIDSGSPEYCVSFYNFSEVGKDKNRLVGGKSFKGTVIAGVTYLNQDRVCVWMENGFCIYANSKQPKKVKQVELKDTIDAVMADDTGVAVLTGGAGDNSKHTWHRYNIEGKEIATKKLGYLYEQAYMNQGQSVFYRTTGCMILNQKGVLKLSCDFEQPISYFLPTDDKTMYYQIRETEIAKLELSGSE